MEEIIKKVGMSAECFIFYQEMSTVLWDVMLYDVDINSLVEPAVTIFGELILNYTT
jgi:hypothetical protein